MITMMLVDDKRDVVEGIEMMYNWKQDSIEIVAKAYDGQSAYEAYLKYKPDIIVSDIRMPHMNGLELTKKVKEDDESVKIILLSGYDDFEFAQKALEYGAEEYLLKPADVESIRESVNRAKEKLIFEKNQKNQKYRCKKNYYRACLF